jgi:DNA polymerase III delta' subunit
LKVRFSEILGHEKATNILARSIEGKRAAHAYIFGGPEGVGKRTVANAFAAALNCQNFTASKGACGECEDCEAIARGVHTSVLCIGPEKGRIKIDKARELQKSLNYKVTRGRRVVIVEDADLMATDAASVLLKTLEEPPGGAVIILVSSRADSLLSTILSRCQRVRFAPLSRDVVVELIVGLRGVSVEDAKRAAQLTLGSAGGCTGEGTGGGISAALRLIDFDMLEKSAEFVKGFLTIAGKKAGGKKADETFELMTMAEKISKEDELDTLLSTLKITFRDMMFVSEGASDLARDLRVINYAELYAGQGTGNKCASELFRRSYHLIDEAQRSIKPPYYANKQLTMETLFLGLGELSA